MSGAGEDATGDRSRPRADADGASHDDESREGRISTGERVFMAVSVLFTLALFAFAVWQALTGPGMVAPEVRVAGSHQGDDGSVVYEVELRNPGGVGVVAATVNVGCTDPPTELVFRNVPAGGRQRALVRCPPGTTDPQVSVVSWIHE